MKRFETLQHKVERPRRESEAFWRIINKVLLGVLVLVLGGLFMYPIDVLKDDSWNLTVQGSSHSPGDTINVSSTYNKVRSAEGVATRYLDCQNEEGAFVRYPVNQAEANRARGMAGTGVVVVIPETIPTPTNCKIAIKVEYRIFNIGGWTLRSVTEYKESKTFDLV